MTYWKSNRCAAVLVVVAAIQGCAVVPQPLDVDEISAHAGDSLDQVTAEQAPVTGPIDLYEAMARALKYNLDHRVEFMQVVLRGTELRAAHFDLLPQVVANSGYAGRDKVNASNSVNVLTGVESLATSTSQDKEISTADVAFSWNILDFGLSYVRARQAADKYLIAEEMRRKIVHRILEDVRSAYWRAVSSERLLNKLQRLKARVRNAQQNARALARDGETSPITAVTYERELVEIKQKILGLQKTLASAKTQLAALMNLKPGTPYRLAQALPRGDTLRLNMNVADMVWTAVHNRSELRDIWYRKRINAHELDAALLEVLPGLQLYAGSNYDSNDFLFHSDWVSWGAKVSWNLLKLVKLPAKRDVIGSQDSLLHERGLAVTMAVMTQVHVSRVRFLHHARELEVVQEYFDVQRRLLRLISEEAYAERASEQTLIREQMNALVAEAKRDIAYAELQNAFANVHASMGLDSALDPDIDALSIESLAQVLRDDWFERGDHSKFHRVATRH